MGLYPLNKEIFFSPKYYRRMFPQFDHSDM